MQIPNSTWGVRLTQMMAIDHSDKGHRGRLYFVYPAGMANTVGRLPAAVMFRYSDDLGKTWSQAARLSADPALKRDALRVVSALRRVAVRQSARAA